MRVAFASPLRVCLDLWIPLDCERHLMILFWCKVGVRHWCLGVKSFSRRKVKIRRAISFSTTTLSRDVATKKAGEGAIVGETVCECLCHAKVYVSFLPNHSDFSQGTLGLNAWLELWWTFSFLLQEGPMYTFTYCYSKLEWERLFKLTGEKEQLEHTADFWNQLELDRKNGTLNTPATVFTRRTQNNAHTHACASYFIHFTKIVPSSQLFFLGLGKVFDGTENGIKKKLM